MNSLTLYPSSWLYNAGVIGFLRSVEEVEQISTTPWLGKDGSLSLKLKFSDLNSEERYFGERKISSIVGKSDLYKNFLQPHQKDVFKRFVKALDSLQPAYCDICGSGRDLPEDQINAINSIDPAKSDDTRFLHRIRRFSIVNYSHLGPSPGKFPNAFWGLAQSAQICHFCSFLIIHHHLAFTPLSDGSEIFINAPSFQVMYHLNKFAREVFGALSSEEARNKRNILAMSVIEYAIKIQVTLGVWTGMNIEVVSRWGSQIEFFSLPYEAIQLLSDRHIAGILSRIGEFAILNRVLDQDFSRLMETGYRLLRIGLKPYGERGKSENQFINQTLRLEKNRRDPARVADQIFQLCALIEEKQNRRKAYEHIYRS